MTAERVYIADHEGMVGAALCRQLHSRCRLITRSREQLDLGSLAAVQAMLQAEKPEQIYLPMPAGAALAGARPAEPLLGRLLDDVLAVSHVLVAAFQARVPRLLFIGSAHVYPVVAEPPLSEEALLTGPLDPDTETLATAQIATIQLCDRLSREHGRTLGMDYRCLVTAAPFGPGDDYLSEQAGRIPRLIRQLQLARECEAPIVRVLARPGDAHEHLHVNDIASAARFLMDLSHDEYRCQTPPGTAHVNAGYGRACSLGALATTIAQIVGYTGIIDCDQPGLQHAPGRVLDSQRMRRWGWRPGLDMEDALALTYFSYLARHARPAARHLAA